MKREGRRDAAPPTRKESSPTVGYDVIAIGYRRAATLLVARLLFSPPTTPYIPPLLLRRHLSLLSLALLRDEVGERAIWRPVAYVEGHPQLRAGANVSLRRHHPKLEIVREAPSLSDVSGGAPSRPTASSPTRTTEEASRRPRVEPPV